MTGEFTESDRGPATPELEPRTHKVVVIRYSEDEWTVSTTWTLFKQADGQWIQCRRDKPEDEAVFNLANQIRWLGLPAGEYALSGERLDATG